MSVTQLRPRNTQNARSVGVNAFLRFLEQERITQEYEFECLARDPSGRCFATTMDKFAMHLAFSEGAKGNTLAANTVMSYFRNVKNWLLAAFPQCKVVIEHRILEMGRILEKHCKEREIGGPSKQANACTKADLARMVQYLYARGSSPSDYQDAALISLMWFVFGRASDLSLLQKNSISVCADTVLFVRFMRLKTSEQQGLTLFPDEDIKTCPVLALAIALAIEKAPCMQLIESVHPAVSKIDDNALRSLPLTELLTIAKQEIERPTALPPVATALPAVSLAPGIHNQVNRLLARIQSPAGVPVPLTSHSFRRGGAQHANSQCGVSIQWIMDRGGWNLSATQKVFSYVVNTTKEDQRVAKILSGWDADAEVTLDSLDRLDDQTQVQIRKFQALLYNTCHGMQNDRFNMCPRVLDACTSRLIRALPELRQLNSDSLIVRRVDTCAAQVGIERSDLVRWTIAFQLNRREAKRAVKKSNPSEHQSTVDASLGLLQELTRANQLLAARIETLEAKINSSLVPIPSPPAASVECEETTNQPPPRKKSPATSLSSVWFEWYAGEPRTWLCEDRKRRSEAKLTVAFMRLFVGAFVLVPSKDDYRDRVLCYGKDAEAKLLAFLRAEGVRANGSSSVLKHMRGLYRHKKLNGYIQEYRSLLASGAIVDPSPRGMQDVLTVKVSD